MSFRELLHVGVWTKRHLMHQTPVPEAAVLTAYLKPTDSVLDIGAHAGSWTVALANLVPQGKVYAFEALPYYARVLTATMRLLRKRNVEVVGHPVLDVRKPVQMVWQNPAGNRLTGLTHVRSDDEAVENTVEVDSLVLDDMFREGHAPVRFIKMDIEGAELLGLRGATQLLATDRPLPESPEEPQVDMAPMTLQPATTG